MEKQLKMKEDTQKSKLNQKLQQEVSKLKKRQNEDFQIHKGKIDEEKIRIDAEYEQERKRYRNLEKGSCNCSPIKRKH